MATTRHKIAGLEGQLFIGGSAQATGVGGISITISSNGGVTGPIMQNGDVTIARSAVGSHVLTINPFKGDLGAVVVAITAQTNGTTPLGVGFSTLYTGNSLAVTLKLYTTSTGTLTDGDFNFAIWAY